MFFFISSRMCFVVPFQIPSESTVPVKLQFPLLKICFIFIHVILVIVNIGLGFTLFPHFIAFLVLFKYEVVGCIHERVDMSVLRPISYAQLVLALFFFNM